MNMIEMIQKNLGFEALQKIDPNTQEVIGAENTMGNSAIAQAAIPAILLGIYNKLEEIPDIRILESVKGNLLERIFGNSSEDIVKKIDRYAKFDDKHSAQQMEHIAAEAIRLVRDQLGDAADENNVRNFVAKNKPDALLYLPPSLDLGTVLKNNNLDDRTGKMEGPVSTFMRNLEKSFNSSSSHN